MKIKVKSFLFHVQYEWDNEPKYIVSSNEDFHDDNWTLIGPVESEFEIPDNFDPRPGKIKSLRAQRAEVQAELTAKLVIIDRKINELLALDHHQPHSGQGQSLIDSLIGPSSTSGQAGVSL